ncbi:MAG: NAD-dependent deacylase [Proteobacteria bacterium]|nr:NAD-dependent deacylase [Pseudomonadota bacterium]
MAPPNVFILTGAGISAESGLSTFRDKDGLWSRYKIEDVASIEGYGRDPQRVLDFYNLRGGAHGDVQPNAGHIALARLEQHWKMRGAVVTVCTQNIDNLHERAGSRRVIHMHGELAKVRCHNCGNVTPRDGDLSINLACAACGQIGGMRPHVVWFGETPLGMDAVYEALAASKLFVSIGTSGSVYPAGGFVRAAREADVATMEINLEPSENADAFDARRYGKASEVLPVWVDEMIGSVGR